MVGCTLGVRMPQGMNALELLKTFCRHRSYRRWVAPKSGLRLSPSGWIGARSVRSGKPSASASRRSRIPAEKAKLLKMVLSNCRIDAVSLYPAYRKPFDLIFQRPLKQKNGAPGETRTPDPLLRRYAVQNSKCRIWCRLRGSASLISPLKWTELGLKLLVLGN